MIMMMMMMMMLSLNRAQNNFPSGLPAQHLYKLAQLSTGTDAAVLLLVSSFTGKLRGNVAYFFLPRDGL